ncbi:MAG: RadC family protein [Clostridia bacterium]|nr:RadC family protein [Clostridia bacterium]
MDHQGHRERLRQRFRQAGLEAFAPHEALELLLTYAIPRRDTKPIAYALLNRFGSLHAVLQASVEELRQVEGVGESAAVLLAMMTPLFRAYRRSLEEGTDAIKNYFQSVRYCEALFEGERYERFYVICLGNGMKRLNTVLIASGDVSEVRVYARHILSALTQCNALGAVITHNHPCGLARPSGEDIVLTNSLAALLDGVGIKLYDHIIVAPTETFSFRRGGLMGEETGAVTEAAQHFEQVLPAVQEEIYQNGTTKKGECRQCGKNDGEYLL